MYVRAVLGRDKIPNFYLPGKEKGKKGKWKAKRGKGKGCSVGQSKEFSVYEGERLGKEGVKIEQASVCGRGGRNNTQEGRRKKKHPTWPSRKGGLKKEAAEKLRRRCLYSVLTGVGPGRRERKGIRQGRGKEKRVVYPFPGKLVTSAACTWGGKKEKGYTPTGSSDQGKPEEGGEKKVSCFSPC